MITNLHIYPSPFKFESRILREAEVLLESGLVDKIIIASGWAKGLKKKEYVQDNIQIIRFKTLSDHLIKYHKFFLAGKYLELYIYITLFYFLKKIDIVNAHSLMVLPIAVLLKRFDKKRKLIYDAHELETERFGLKGKAQKYSKTLEKKLIRRCDRVIVVGNYIRKWYVKEYSLNENQIYTVRNFNNVDLEKTTSKSNYLRKHFDLNPDDIIFIYQGLLSKGRGIDIYIEAFKSVQSNFKLVLMGYGPLESEIKNICDSYSNIFFHQAVKPSEIINVTSSADIGLCLIENYCLSYYYSLPNKLFEYVNAGIPVIGSNFPEISELVATNGIGWVIDPGINQLIDVISSEKKLESRIEKKNNIGTFVKKFNWRIEQLELIKTYQNLASRAK